MISHTSSCASSGSRGIGICTNPDACRSQATVWSGVQPLGGRPVDRSPTLSKTAGAASTRPGISGFEVRVLNRPPGTSRHDCGVLLCATAVRFGLSPGRVASSLLCSPSFEPLCPILGRRRAILDGELVLWRRHVGWGSWTTTNSWASPSMASRPNTRGASRERGTRTCRPTFPSHDAAQELV
jgi:hypothetical protein